MSVDQPPSEEEPATVDENGVAAADARHSRPSDPSRPTRPARRGLPALVALLTVAALAAGVLTTLIARLPARTPSRTTAQLPEEVVVDGLAARAEAAALEHVVLQLDDWNQCPWPDCTTPWGHVPEFTLLDDGRVVYMDVDPADPARWIARAAAPSPDDMARLTEQVGALLAGGAPPLAAGEPCPAANGCPGGLIVRVRRGGELRTYHGEAGVDPDAWSALAGAAELLRGWTAEEGAPLPRTMVVQLAAVQRWEAHEYTPPDMANEMPVLLEREALDGFAKTFAKASGVSDGSPGAADYLDAPRGGLPAFAALDDGTVYQPAGWALKTGETPIPTLDGSDRSVPFFTRLVFVPWIYPNVDVVAILDGYREARRNAAAARAAAAATAEAQIAYIPPMPSPTDDPYSHDGDAVSEPAATPYPTAPGVIWTDDGRPQLPFARGIQTWMHWFRGDADRAAIGRLRQAGFGWFKQRFAWKDIEPDRPEGWPNQTVDMFVDPYVEAVRQHGGQVMIQLGVPPQWALDDPTEGVPFNLSAWRAFVDRFATRFSGRVAAYEIMNEPNLAREWGGPPDPAAYARVLGAAYEAIKRADPSAVVISAGLAPTGDRMPEAMADVAFLDALEDVIEGTHEKHFDALGLHAAGFKAAPDVSPEEAAASADLGGDSTFTFRHIEELIAAAHKREAVPSVITEFGWTTDPRPDSPYHWMAIDAATRGKHIAQAFALAPTLFGGDGNIGPMVLFSAADRAWTPDDEAYWWAVADGDGNVDGAVMEALGSGGGDAER